ncbi:MAG: hypothetical protein L0G99_00850 [Propionibacteriales bacterium]|nr:hypothetical protein [Propionibacteriales bacterium]
MINSMRPCVVTVALLATIALSGCGTGITTSGETTAQQSFEFTGTRLAVVNDNSNMPVTLSRLPDDQATVRVEVRTDTRGRRSETPAWSLTGSTLNLGSPCGASWVGYCEATYEVGVPKGTQVTVNGEPVTVR